MASSKPALKKRDAAQKLVVHLFPQDNESSLAEKDLKKKEDMQPKYQTTQVSRAQNIRNRWGRWSCEKNLGQEWAAVIFFIDGLVQDVVFTLLMGLRWGVV